MRELALFSGAGGGILGGANRMDRTRATGNGQVPAVAALAWRPLSQGLLEPMDGAGR